MRKLAIAAFVPNADHASAIRSALDGPRWAVEIHEVHLSTAKAICAHWTIVPEILILDVSDEEHPEAQLRAFAESAPSGETHLIVIGKGHDIRTYKTFRDMGALEYLHAPIDAGDVLHAVEAVARSIAAKTGVQDPAKVIIVTGARGGAGASTLASEIARGISTRHGKNVMLVDLDIEAGCQHSMFDVEPTKGFAMMLDDPTHIDALMLNRSVAKPQANKNLSILSDTMPDTINRYAHSTGVALTRAISTRDDVTILDIPARSPFLHDLIGEAKTLVVAAPATYHGLRETIAILDLAEKAGGVTHPIVAICKDGEVRNGSVSIDAFRQKLSKGARPDFRDAVQVISVPYAPKQALLASNNAESLLADPGPLGKAFAKLLAAMPTAPDLSAKRGKGFLSRILKS